MSAAARSDPLGRSVAEFVDHLALERRLSPHTTSAYRRDLDGLVAYVRSRKRGPATPGDVSKLLLRAYLGEIAKELSAASLARKLAAIRSFFRHLVRTAEIDASPADLVGTPRVHRKLPM